jgi:hypothetical protein
VSHRFSYRFAIGAATALLGLGLLATTSAASADESTAVGFVCVDGGAALSAVDVLEATGEHGEFLRYFQEFDPEGYAILSDPALADKTIWAPTDAAFAALGDAPKALSPEEIKAVLGFHVSPPKRTPEGPYPIITFDYLAENGQVIFQTRTGVLTDSDQRVRATVDNGVYTVEGRGIQPTAWCTQAGSVFAIDEVITDVPVAGWAERTLGLAIYYAFFEYPYLTILAGLVLMVVVIWLVVRRVRARRRPA